MAPPRKMDSLQQNANTEQQKQKGNIFSFSLKVKQMKEGMKNLKDC